MPVLEDGQKVRFIVNKQDSIAVWDFRGKDGERSDGEEVEAILSRIVTHSRNKLNAAGDEAEDNTKGTEHAIQIKGGVYKVDTNDVIYVGHFGTYIQLEAQGGSFQYLISANPQTIIQP